MNNTKRVNSEKDKARTRLWMLNNKDRQYENLKRHRLKLRDDALRAYSVNGIPACTCCEESVVRFLCIDHINNDGNLHRKELGNPTTIYHWLKKNNYPLGFQVLCYNCNLGKAHNKGVCPHKSV